MTSRFTRAALRRHFENGRRPHCGGDTLGLFLQGDVKADTMIDAAPHDDIDADLPDPNLSSFEESIAMATKPSVQVRRVYEQPKRGDGTRVLVDRIWPRGLTKEKADLDEWCKDVAPSTALRRWYAHDPARFAEFRRRYRAELEQPTRAEALAHMRAMAKKRTLTLLTATKQPELSEAAVLADLLQR